MTIAQRIIRMRSSIRCSMSDMRPSSEGAAGGGEIVFVMATVASAGGAIGRIYGRTLGGGLGGLRRGRIRRRHVVGAALRLDRVPGDDLCGVLLRTGPSRAGVGRSRHLGA